jgi:hypothetical protein
MLAILLAVVAGCANALVHHHAAHIASKHEKPVKIASVANTPPSGSPDFPTNIRGSNSANRVTASTGRNNVLGLKESIALGLRA